MDVLSDVFRHVRLASGVAVQPVLAAPWGLAFAQREEAVFHLVDRGELWLRMAGREPQPLRSGDVVVLPRGDAHELADAAGTKVSTTGAELEALDPGERRDRRVGGDGAECLLISGFVGLRRDGVHPLLTELPPVIHVRAGEGWRGTWVEHGVDLMTTELASAGPGSEEIVERMLDVLFLQAVRSCIGTDEQCGGWLRALGDERIAAALGRIHAEPGARWTTGRLAEAAGMSRSPFASRFTELMGEPPPHYLTRWRIQVALGALRERRGSLAQIADAVGYSTTKGFARVFKRMVGMAPAQYRRVVANGMLDPLANTA